MHSEWSAHWLLRQNLTQLSTHLKTGDERCSLAKTGATNASGLPDGSSRPPRCAYYPSFNLRRHDVRCAPPGPELDRGRVGVAR